MALVLPYPGTPQNGQTGDATPISANFTAIAQAVQSFDGSQIAATTVVGSALNSAINPITRDNLIVRNFVSSGCIWTTVSGLQGTMSSGTLFINGNMVTVNGVVSNSFTASNDTYIDIDYNGNIYYQAVSNNVASPAITANSVRVAVVVCGASITSTNQGSTTAVNPTVSNNILTVCDSLGNLIYPTSPSGGLIGYRYITANSSAVVNATGALLTGLTLPIISPGNRRLKITVKTRQILINNSPKYAYLQIWDGTVGSGTKLDETAVLTTTTNQGSGCIVQSWTTPASGLKTYNAGLASDADAVANAVAVATSTYPAFISIELE